MIVSSSYDTLSVLASASTKTGMGKLAFQTPKNDIQLRINGFLLGFTYT